MATRSNNCLTQVGAGVALGSSLGGAVGACYGTIEAFRHKTEDLSAAGHNTPVMMIPGLLKIRYIGRTTVGTAVTFGLFLGAGSLIHSGKSY